MELTSYKKRKRAEVCAFSPHFKERVKEIRAKLGIPQGGVPKEARVVLGPPEKGFPKELNFYPLEATKWYTEHIQKETGKKPEDLPRNLPRYYWYFPREIAELIEDFTWSQQPCRPGFYPDVPLDRCAMDLVQEFGLPEDAVNEVKHHILVEEGSGFTVSPKMEQIVIPMDGRDGLYFCVLIAGVDGSTTKKEWLELWEVIQGEMNTYRDKVLRAPTKREAEENETRDLTWWKWSQQGLSADQIANRWSKKHPEAAYGKDTVSAAINKIKQKMRPISQNGP